MDDAEPPFADAIVGAPLGTATRGQWRLATARACAACTNRCLNAVASASLRKQ
jgi:hypothetical protein